MSTLLIAFTAIALATVGQLLLKAGMVEVGEPVRLVSSVGVGGMLGRALTTWQVPLGLGVFGLSAMFWLVTLSRLPLSVAYPIVSLSYLLILAFSVIVLGERPALTVWIGALLIMVGIALIGVGQR
ncbi:MAG: EamA family transporter [Actinobacteria bacterium]|nr:EamA family transporter [Actinomycetota bacterium]